MKLSARLTAEQQFKARKMIARIQRYFLSYSRAKFICCHIEEYCAGMGHYYNEERDPDFPVIEKILIDYIRDEMLAGAYTVGTYLEEVKYMAYATEEMAYQYRLEMLERLLKELT